MLAGRVCRGAAVDVEVHPVSTLSSFLSCSPVLISLARGRAVIKAPGLPQHLPAFTYAPRSAAFIDFLMQSQVATCSKILWQNLSLASEQILLAWRRVSRERASC